eukprot:7089666-Prymnesium_polylepis.3
MKAAVAPIKPDVTKASALERVMKLTSWCLRGAARGAGGPVGGGVGGPAGRAAERMGSGGAVH